MSGSGIKTTQKFSTPEDDWDLAWTYNCASYGGRGNFQVYVTSPDGTPSGNAGVNELGAGGSSVEYFHQGGTFYLVMNSECTWSVKVTG